MHERPHTRTPLPPRPEGASEAIDTAHRLLAALVDRDLDGASALFAPTACVWWSRRGGLASIEGPGALSRSLVDLLDLAPPTRLALIASSPCSAVTSAYGDERLLWTLELQVAGDEIAAAYLRGARLTT